MHTEHLKTHGMGWGWTSGIMPDRPNTLAGVDRRFVGYWEKNYIPITLMFERDIPEFDQRLVACMRKWLDNPKSRFRARLTTDETVYTYDTRSTDDLLPLFVRRVTRVGDKASDDHILSLLRGTGQASLLCYSNSGMTMCGNHQFFDGVSSFGYFREIFDGGEELFRQQTVYPYYPMVTEMSLVRSVRHVVHQYTRQLRYGPDWQTSEHGDCIQSKLPLALIKDVKRRATEASDEKISFSSAYIARVLIDLSASLVVTTKKLVVGVLVAFDPSKRFNNYGIIRFEIQCPTKDTPVVDLTVEIQRELMRNRDMAPMTFYLGTLDVPVLSDACLDFGSQDILFSGLPLTAPDTPLLVNGVRLHSTRQFLDYSTSPVYCMYLSCDQYVHTTISLRSPDVDTHLFSRNLNKYGVRRSIVDMVLGWNMMLRG